MKRTSQRGDTDAAKPSMVRGQLGVRVIGAQTEAAGTPSAHTVYRTAVNYHGVRHQRLIRFRDFLAFASKVKVQDGAPLSVAFPPRMWTRKASLRPEVVEARRVLIDEYMQQVCAKELAPRTEERLLRLLQVAHHGRSSTGAVGHPRPSKGSDAALNGERRTLDVARESAEASLAMMSLPVREEDEPPSAAASATTLHYRSAVPEMKEEGEEEEEEDQDSEGGKKGAEEDALVSETQQSSGELAAESDAREGGGRVRRAASLPPPVLAVAAVRSAPRPSALRSSESLPPVHLRKAVDFADSPAAEDAAADARWGYADSGASSASSSPSPANKYEAAVLARRARIGELLQAGARVSGPVESAA